jgi:hypothetical protein
LSLFSAGDYIQIENISTTSVLIYKIENVVSDTEIKLSTVYSLATASNCGYYKLNKSIYIDQEIADALYDVNLNIGLKNTSLDDSFTELETLQIFYCHAQCCLDSMFMKLSSKLCTTCDFETYVKDLMTLESLVQGVKYAECCPNPEYVSNIFKLISRICNYNNCQCH